MKSPPASKPETAPEARCGARVTPRTGWMATDQDDAGWAPAVPGPAAAFARFVLCGGGAGVASSAAVSLCAALMPWAVANALITVASTLLCTELHARFTFGAGRRAGWRRHWQSAGSAVAAYAVTCAAMAVLHMVRPSPGIFSEQAVYLSAAGLAGTGRFLVLRLFVFTDSTRHRTRIAAPPQGCRTGPALNASGAHVSVRRYDVDPTQAVRRVCARAGGELTRAQWRPDGTGRQPRGPAPRLEPAHGRVQT